MDVSDMLPGFHTQLWSSKLAMEGRAVPQREHHSVPTRPDLDCLTLLEPQILTLISIKAAENNEDVKAQKFDKIQSQLWISDCRAMTLKA